LSLIRHRPPRPTLFPYTTLFRSMAMKPGRFWFSLPRPYVTHEPREGRTSRASPQFMSKSDGSWLGTSAYIDRITQTSSMHAPTRSEEHTSELQSRFDLVCRLLLE